MARAALMDIRRIDRTGGFRPVEAAVYLFSGPRSSMALEAELPAGLDAGSGEVTAAKAALKGRRAVLSLPMEAIDFRVLSFAFSDREKLGKLLPYELDGLVIGGASSVVFDFIVTPADGSFEVLVAYADKGAVEAALKAAASAGADPEAITCIELGALVSSGARVSAAAVAAFRPPSGPERAEAALAGFMRPVIDLRTGPGRGALSRSAALRSGAVLLALLAFFMAADLAAMTAAYRRDAAASRARVREGYTRLLPADTIAADELHQMKARVKELKEGGGVAPALGVILALSKAGARGVVLNELTVDGAGVTLRGEAASAAAAEAAATAYSSFLVDAKVSEVAPLRDGRAAFTLTARSFDEAARPRRAK